MAEHSERGRYISEIIALWIANDGDIDPDHGERIAFVAAREAARSHQDLAQYATTLIRTARTGSAAAHVRAELAANDFDRIDWAAVSAELEGITG